MLFKPVDETSLRHLFSTPLARELLKLSYVSPVTDPNGRVEQSPDALILDMRESRYIVRRCEFKWIPNSKDAFSHNDKFDVAVIWSLGKNITEEELKQDLLEQNGCSDIIILDKFQALRQLPEYNKENHEKLIKAGNSEEIKKMLLYRNPATVVAAYIAAKLYPKQFNLTLVTEYLTKRFPDVRKMEPRGRVNVVTALRQTKPRLIKLMNNNNYRWNDEYPSKMLLSEIASIIEVNFKETIPTIPNDDEINRMASSTRW